MGDLQVAMSKREQGFALIFVLVFVAMIVGVVGDLVYQTQVAARATIEQENEMEAEVTAHTGVEFAKLLLTLNSIAADYKDNPAFPLPRNLYEILNGQPIGANGFDEIQKLTKLPLGSAIDPHIIQALSVVKGYFVIKISSENMKFNVNLLQSTYSAVAQKALLRIFSTPDAKKFLELYNYTPQELVDNLNSYVRISTSDEGILQTQVAYERIGAKYSAKQAALESLEELRRVPGFHLDDIYNMFTPYLTIWPLSAPKNGLNINSAPAELVSALMTPAGEELIVQDWDKFDDFRQKGTFAKNNIGSWFQSNLTNYTGNTDSDDIRKNIFGSSDTVYRVESRGVVNGVEKTLTLILQPNDGTQTKSSSPTPTPGVNPQDPTKPSTSADGDTSATAGKKQSTGFSILYSQWN